MTTVRERMCDETGFDGTIDTEDETQQPSESAGEPTASQATAADGDGDVGKGPDNVATGAATAEIDVPQDATADDLGDAIQDAIKALQAIDRTL